MEFYWNITTPIFLFTYFLAMATSILYTMSSSGREERYPLVAFKGAQLTEGLPCTVLTASAFLDSVHWTLDLPYIAPGHTVMAEWGSHSRDLPAA